MWFVFCISLHWNTQHPPHLSWVVFPTSVLWLKYHWFPHKHLLHKDSLEVTILNHGRILSAINVKLWVYGLKGSPVLSALMWFGTHASPSSAMLGFTSSWPAGKAGVSAPVGVILAVWWRQRGGCRDCQWEEVEWRGCHGERAPFPLSQPLIGCSHDWGKEILPIGNNWCFVAGPSCPDTKLMFITYKIAPQVCKGGKYGRLCCKEIQKSARLSNTSDTLLKLKLKS